MSAVPVPDWVARTRAIACAPALQPREALYVAGQVVGSVQRGLLPDLGLDNLRAMGIDIAARSAAGETSWWLQAEAGDGATLALLNRLAQVLRADGRCGPWRDEQLAVRNPEGERIATVERGAVRVLGIATQAVHLVGVAPDGRLWVQQRAADKAMFPNRWDTLMGGMVSADDSLDTALARETWEEAGLRLAALQGLRYGGFFDLVQPSDEGDGCGYIHERIHWYVAAVPDGVAPDNQDGEVQGFALLPTEQVQAWASEEKFTPEAALVWAGYWGW
ncbi:NUDIX domain-containing protein [Pantoea sp. 18069]|uniref:NUDIX hydrolase n=1 Tax=Pantoea sp. 18069 TaxID=2681415 RepID=UPI00135CBD7B|nr:NUDIX domain-containing protein [Pantoea sp. 18069]